jgi:hypothetical protein
VAAIAGRFFLLDALTIPDLKGENILKVLLSLLVIR